eukprot:3308842-Prymnesium_polylepis.1
MQTHADSHRLTQTVHADSHRLTQTHADSRKPTQTPRRLTQTHADSRRLTRLTQTHADSRRNPSFAFQNHS